MALLAALLLAVPASAAACGEEGNEDTGPLVTEAKISPANLPSEGGTVAVSARVEDDCGIQQVYAEIYSTEGIYQSVQLLPFEVIDSNAIVYRGEFQVPPNFQEWEVGYQANVLAEDTNGAFAEAYAGEVDIAGAPQFDEPPYIGETQLFPTYLQPEGGEVTIRVEASDNRGLSEIFAVVSAVAGGNETEVPLQAFESNRFEGTFSAPPNAGPLAAEYIVEAVARDDIGQEARSLLGTVTVAAPTPPLSPGMLKLKAPGHIFHSLKLGKQAHWIFAVRNLPRGKRGGVVSALARIAGSSAFSLDGVGAEGVHFTLQPGEKLKLPVTFAPTTAGPQSASIEIVRDDGGQAGLATTLSGEGRAPKPPKPPKPPKKPAKSHR